MTDRSREELLREIASLHEQLAHLRSSTGTQPATADHSQHRADPRQFVFQHMGSGCALHEIEFDSSNKPLDAVILDVNASFARMTGLNRDDIVGRRATELNLPLTREVPDFIHRLGQVAISGIATVFEFFDESTGRRFSLSACSPRRGSVVTFLDDITETNHSKKEEAADRQYLEDLIRERTAQLKDANDLLYKEMKKNRASSEELHRSQEQYGKIVEDLPDLICRYRPDTTITFVNDAYAHYFGKGRDQLVGSSFLSLIPSESHEYIRKKISSLNRENPVTSMEHEVLTPEGKTRWQLWRDRALFDSAGRIIEIQSIGRDVTAEKKLDQLIRESEKRYRELVELSTDIIYTSDREGTQTFMNTAAFEKLEASPGEVIGRPWSEWIHPDDRQRSLEAFQQMIAEGKDVLDFENRYLSKSGRVIHAIHNVRLLRDKDGNVVGAQGIARDITVRKQSMEEAKEQRDFLRDLIETIPNPVFYKDLEGRYRGCNRAFEEFVGRPGEDIIGKTVYDMGPKEIADRYYEMDQKLFDNPGRQQYEWQVKSQDGTVKDVIFNKATFTDAHGNVQGLIGVISDISGRKEIESELLERIGLAELNADIGRTLSVGTSLHEILQSCSEILVQHLDAFFVRIWTFNEAGNTLQLRASAGHYTHIDGEHGRIPYGQFKIGMIAKERKPHLTNNVIGDPSVHNQEWAQKEGIVSFAGHPLLVGEKLLGVMALFSRKPLTDVTLKALSSVADILALGINQKQADLSLQKSRDLLINVLDGIEAIVYVADMKTHKLLYMNRFMKEVFGDQEGKICWQTIQTEQSGPCSFCTNDKLISEDGNPAGVYHWEFQNTINGKWYDIRDRAIEWIDGRLARLEIATDITDRKQAEELLRSMSFTDDLTGLHNRRGFLTLAHQHLKLSRRDGKGALMIFADLDDMKWINDTLGHVIGDHALLDVTGILKQTFRESDIIARIGGDEFVVLATETPEINQQILTDRLQAHLDIHNTTENRRYTLSLSIGITRFDPDEPCSVDVLLARADSLMYDQKKQKKNSPEEH